MPKRLSLRATTVAATVAAALSVAMPSLAAETLRSPTDPAQDQPAAAQAVGGGVTDVSGNGVTVAGAPQNPTDTADSPGWTVTALLTESARAFSASPVRLSTTGTGKPDDSTIEPTGRIAATSAVEGSGGSTNRHTTTTSPDDGTTTSSGRIAAKSFTSGWSGWPSTTRPTAPKTTSTGRIAAKSLPAG